MDLDQVLPRRDHGSPFVLLEILQERTMKHRLLVLLVVLSSLLAGCTWISPEQASQADSPLPASEAQALLFGGKEAYPEWHLNVHFVNGSRSVSQAGIQAKIDEWVRIAERVYQRRPTLKIRYER
jgi:hypothetical protein